MASCTNCATKFSLFRPEKGCAQCGFSFCSKCLGEKALVPKSGQSKPVNVCRNCFLEITAKGKPKEEKQDEHIFMSPVKKPIINPITPTPPTMATVNANSSKTDSKHDEDEIRKRLDNLRPPAPSPITHDELEDRLTLLKGLDPEKCRNDQKKPFHIPVDRRTQVEQTKDLISQIVDEVNIDKNVPRPEDEIERRLAKLKDQPERIPSRHQERGDEVDPSKFLSGEVHDDWSTKHVDEVDKLIRQYSGAADKSAAAGVSDLYRDPAVADYMKSVKAKKQEQSKKKGAGKKKENTEEGDDDESSSSASDIDEINQIIEAASRNELDEKSNSENKSQADSVLEQGELPYCSICNEDAIFRCVDCDGDLYCKRCFKECHDKDDEHQFIVYSSKRT